jgi:alkylation response protein AidB-like acyl-CoA dehydrogenase
MSVDASQLRADSEAREREAFRSVVRDFLADACNSATVRAAMEDRTSQPLDQEMAKLGLFGVEVPENLGGGDGSFRDLSVVLESLGEFSAVAPLLSSAVLCTGALLFSTAEVMRQRWLPQLAAGEALGAVAMQQVFTSATGEPVVATPEGDGWRLRGSAQFVPDAATADVLAVVASQTNGTPVIGLVERGTSGLSTTPRLTTDRTRRLDDVLLEDVAVSADQVLAAGQEASRLMETLIDRFSVAVALDSVGVASRVVDMTTEYVKQREQFGRPIGSFQAVKHQVADMYVQTQAVRLLTRDATDRLAASADYSHLVASQTKEYAVSAAARVTGTALQMHGGIGYTWEHDLHIYFKRAQLNTALGGDIRWHRARAADYLIPATTDQVE